MIKKLLFLSFQFFENYLIKSYFFILIPQIQTLIFFDHFDDFESIDVVK